MNTRPVFALLLLLSASGAAAESCADIAVIVDRTAVSVVLPAFGGFKRAASDPYTY